MTLPNPATDFDVVAECFHDVPEAVVRVAMDAGAPVQSETPFGPPWPLSGWPDVPTRFLAAQEIDELPGGHLLALSQPVELADHLEGYLAQDL